MRSALRVYSLPLLLALALHGALVVVISRATQPSDEVAQVVTPKAVKAKLIMLQAKPRATVVPKTMPAAKPAAKPQAPEPKPATSEPLPQTRDLEAEAELARQQRKAEMRARRLAALGDLDQTRLQESMAEEALELSQEDNQEIVSSYRNGIYERVWRNWSRPPSARNGMKALFVIELVPTGEIVSVTLIEGSNNAAFDRSAEQAIRGAKRFVVPAENRQFEAYFRRFRFLFEPQDLMR